MSEIQGISPPDTSPDKAIPLPSAPAIPSPLPSPKALRQWLPLYLKKTDNLICHLDRILSTPSGIDSFLMIVGYSSLTTSSLLGRISLHRLHSSARKLISLATNLPANTTILIASSDIPTPRLMRLSQSLKALSGLISDFRIFTRLWSLLSIWKWGKSLLDDPPKDVVFKSIAWAQVAVNVAFQVLENGAYLASKGVLGWDPKTQGKAWAWSSRFWATHVALEFVRLARERQIYAAKGKGKEGALDTEEVQTWKKEVISNLAYAPMTLHWSFEEGLVSELGIGLLGIAAGASGFARRWRQTA